MNTLAALVLAHLIGDFLLQPKSWVRAKEDRKGAAWQLYVHVLLHTALTFAALAWTESPALWPLALLLAGSHFLIDLIKLYGKQERYSTAWFFGDQGAHLLTIALVWVYSIEQNPAILPGLLSGNTIIYVTTGYFLIQPASIIMENVMRPWSEALATENASSLPNAGKIIGVLERVLVFGFIASGHFEAVGFLLAAKSVFRFGDLSQAGQRKLTEYMLIGTLISFGLAIAIGMAVTSLLA